MKEINLSRKKRLSQDFRLASARSAWAARKSSLERNQRLNSADL